MDVVAHYAWFGAGLLLMTALTVGLGWWAGTGLRLFPLWAILRAVVQLSVIALLLRGILSVPWTVVGFVLLMLTTASLTAIGRIHELWHGRNFLRTSRARKDEVEAWLSLGATPARAHQDIGRESVRESLIPTLDQTKSTGLVTLPGAFVGALFGGASPGNAARFQLVVLVGLLAAEAVAAATLTWLLGAPDPLPLAPVEPVPTQTRTLRRPRRRAVG